MQSEAGAAGALHGALKAGAFSTTFTASNLGLESGQGWPGMARNGQEWPGMARGSGGGGFCGWYADSGSCFGKKEATRGMRGGGLRRLTELTVP